jgi:hypothetical protein
VTTLFVMACVMAVQMKSPDEGRNLDIGSRPAQFIWLSSARKGSAV